MLYLKNKYMPLGILKNNLINRKRALCEGKTFKALNTNVLLNCIIFAFALVLALVAMPNKTYAATHTVDGVTYTYEILDAEARIIKVEFPIDVTGIEIPNRIAVDNDHIYIVRELCDRAFYQCTSLKSVIIPEGVIYIDDETFYGCTSLENVSIPESVINIGNYAFKECTSLTEIKLPSILNFIGAGMFSGCTKLNSIQMPTQFINDDKENLCIGFEMFEGCTKIERVTIPEGTIYLEIYTFIGCTSLKEINLPSTLEYIGAGAFEECRALESITLPEGVTNIDNGAFRNCTSLKSIKIPRGVTKIENNGVFYGCSALKEIILPNSLTNIKDSEIVFCRNLEKISLDMVIDEKDSNYTMVNGALYDKVNKKIVMYPFKKSDITEYIIPEGTVTIGANAFRNTTLEKITIPSSVTNIGQYNSSFSGRNSNLVIYCKKNSTSHNYAIEYGIKFSIIPFEANISYGEPDLINKKIVATIALNEKISNGTKEILNINNWTYNETELILQKTYNIENQIDENVQIIDWLGNEKNVHNNIDYVEPSITIVYSTKDVTNEKIVVLIVANENISNEISIIQDGEIIKTEEWNYLLSTNSYILKNDFNTNTNLQIKVKDIAGNYSETNIIEINNIIKEDKIAPEVKIEVINKDIITKTKSVMITATDDLSGLYEENEYKYCMSSSEELKGDEKWKNYNLGESFVAGENLTGEYFLHIKQIRDKVENASTIVRTTKMKFDNTAPNITINETAIEENKYSKSTITIEEENYYEVVLTRNNAQISYTKGMEINQIGSYQIKVTDIAGNISTKSFDISKYITFGEYTAVEDKGKMYLTNISSETTLESFITNLQTNLEDIEVQTKNDENLSGEKYIGTGMTVEIEGINYTIVVKGDSYKGDGIVNTFDLLAMFYHKVYAGKGEESEYKLSTEKLKAADINNNGKVDSIDMLKIFYHKERIDGYRL